MHEVKLQVPAYERKQEEALAGGGARFGTAASRLHAGDRVPTTMRAQKTRSNANMAARRAAQVGLRRAVPFGIHSLARSLEASVVSAERATRFNGDGRASGLKGGL